ncbi:hypothetical protein [Phaeobacter gallaeciensis]|uniref:hypothetical protein n=1 Tax=Phaeobacter gallaeciensis TaxID=60890 RepID=UPI00237FD1BA|nr:hypothetical protein [Phaeobacter gallaeciensis]MDE4099724.1 hypothetical protein [Phaeobacter gallaeciensis]MDE4108541.1 hypothetical protein [Phaeobacter gallaeciensis]MDE4110443.1 hypothetical protein [Phaeobacter gallaeciensis]MDE4117365.1 hypothetical protein [Phaeobacter gallaeciensis]MDE4121839.1 hypothetical protein [Phaeobacter gallaeciensis]
MIVDLGRTLSVGEEVTVRFRHQMKDLAGTFRPFFKFKPSTEIQERLNLRLTLPNWDGVRCHYHRFTHDTEKVVEVEEVPLQLNEAGKISIHKQIVNPSEQNMGHKLEWSHDED